MAEAWSRGIAFMITMSLVFTVLFAQQPFAVSQEHAVNDLVGRTLLRDALSPRSRQSARQDCILPVDIPDGYNCRWYL